MRIRNLIWSVALVVFVLAVWRLSSLQAGGPAHFDLTLQGGLPATMYLPGSQAVFSLRRVQADQPRNPGVVLFHGFSGDRNGMSTLARWIAQSGYAVLAIDVHGHGENRNPFVSGYAGDNPMERDARAAVDYIRSLAPVDPAKIVVMGHSMGAGIALAYATQDAKLAASVMISGGWSLDGGPERPRNALFIYASGDPDRIRFRSAQLATTLAGVQDAEQQVTYGTLAEGNAVRAVQIGGADHITIITTPAAGEEIIKWLDGATGNSRTAALSLSDRRRPAAGLAFLAFAVLLSAIGAFAAQLAPKTEKRERGNQWGALGILALALIATMPLISTPALSLISLEVGDVTASWFAVAGMAIVVGLTLRNRLNWSELLASAVATLIVAGLAAAAVYFMIVPLGVVFHRMTLTPERFYAAALLMLFVLPLFFAMELLLRRGSTMRASVMSGLGKLLVVILIFSAVALGLMPQVVGLMVPLFFFIFVLFELFAIPVYMASANLGVIAIFEAGFLAWTLAAMMPIRI